MTVTAVTYLRKLFFTILGNLKHFYFSNYYKNPLTFFTKYMFSRSWGFFVISHLLPEVAGKGVTLDLS